MGSSVVAAYAGLALLAVSLFLSTRSRRLAVWCGDLPRQLRWHHRAALAALVLILIHVTFEIVSVAGISPQILASWDVWADPAMLLGLLALLVLVLVGALAFLGRLQHRTWLAVHRLGILAVVVAWLHAFVLARSAADVASTRYVILALAAFAAALAGVAPIWVPSQRRLRIAAVRCLGGQLWEVLLDPKPLRTWQQPVAYPAGSLVDVKFLNPRMTRAWHPLSVASCRKEPCLRLIIRACGRDTNLLSELRSGNSLDMRGPFDSPSSLARNPASKEVWQVWLGAGVGVAPFVGLLHCLGVLDFGKICFVHFDRDSSERAVVQGISEQICKDAGILPSRPRVIVRPAFSDNATHHNAETVIAHLVEEFPGARFRICGPPGFVRVVADALKHAGVAKWKITKEGSFR